MDRTLKERIIGAIVLVVVAILVVPVFLDGPPDAGEIVSEAVALPGQSGQEVKRVVLERDREDPVPATASPPPETRSPSPESPPAREASPPVVADATPQRQPPPETRSPSPEPPPAREASPPVVADAKPQRQPPSDPKPAPVKPAATASSTGMWAVQLGSFSNQQNAEKLAADLRKQGFAAFLSQLRTDKGPLHRVRIGPQKDRDTAEAMAARLQKAGQRGQVVPHP